MAMEYDLLYQSMVNQCRSELTENGYEQLTTAEEVEDAVKRTGTTLFMINSVCGCAGGIARPAAVYSLNYPKRPDHVVTVFAGQDKEATAMARMFFGEDHIPSSPSFVLMNNGKAIAEIPRHEIEGHDPVSVVTKLQGYFEDYCDEI
ncbi:BrxA/BrxB family bacilliredoxin [Kurthia senegalensis]|uniref:BrxA/BrxB family bacilliredoxin n=1 Tax=Kurthia senegalensis TaxID=1033740 RepID=UPI000287C4EA|nr:BrxA/BrxB family bacilliredoxin [Kurthia senegalensis]